MNAQQRGALPGDIWAPGDPWPVNWSGVWVGALAALAAALVFGLIGAALGWHLVGPAQRVTDWKTVSLTVAGWSIVSAFFAFVIGGWISVRVAGIRHSEPSMLHGAVTWLLGVPILLAAMALGGGAYLGSWYNGLAPSWAATPAPAASATINTGSDTVPADPNKAAAEEAAKVARNASLMAITVLLLGLMGSVLGGWMGSGEPMTFRRSHSEHQRPLTEGAQITVRDTGAPAERTAV